MSQQATRAGTAGTADATCTCHRLDRPLQLLLLGHLEGLHSAGSIRQHCMAMGKVASGRRRARGSIRCQPMQASPAGAQGLLQAWNLLFCRHNLCFAYPAQKEMSAGPRNHIPTNITMAHTGTASAASSDAVRAVPCPSYLQAHLGAYTTLPACLPASHQHAHHVLPLHHSQPYSVGAEARPHPPHRP